jgi:hypothetical protein
MIIANTNQCKMKKLNKMELEAQKKKGLLKKILKITTGIRSRKYEVGQTMQWPREKGQKDKQ